MTGIKAIALDVDGVLTDGAFWWGPNGEEWKRFSFTDIMGLSLARKAGLRIALISGEDSPLVDRLAAKIGITDVYKSCKDKAAALRSFADRHQLPLDEICFMGDDVNDLGALEIAGLSAAPADARRAVLEKVSFVSGHSGGNGAVRELIDAVLAAQQCAVPAEWQFA
jgi:3-deoxy-D-manno-octulosonate 8-phosphate phosphatase (KDO 8-P phosphatase)